MRIVNIHEAKTQLSRLIELAVAGEPFIIAKAGKPLVKIKKWGQSQLLDQKMGSESIVVGE